MYQIQYIKINIDKKGRLPYYKQATRIIRYCSLKTFG